MDDFNKPNVVLPMTASLNQRGIEGFTAFDADKDQLKVNTLYEMVGREVYLKKRPGFYDGGLTLGTASASDQPLYCVDPVSFDDLVWMLSNTAAGAIRAHTIGGVTHNIVSASAGTYIPFVSTVIISGLPHKIVQTAKGAGDPQNSVQRAFFSQGPITSWNEISASAFASEQVVHGKLEHIDGFTFALCKSNRIINSRINSLALWDRNDFISKQIKSDLPVGLARLGGTLLAFGYETVEGFYNGGNAVGSPLARRAELSTNIGLGMWRVAGHFGNAAGTVGTRSYYAIVGNVLYFVGSVDGGKNQFGLYAFTGGAFEKVSTRAVDRILAGAGLDTANDDFVESVNRFTFQGREAVAISLKFASAATQRWLMYFPDVKDWVEWNSTVFQPVGNGQYYVGTKGTYSNKVMTQDLSTGMVRWLDDSVTAYDMIHQFKLPKKSNAREAMAWCGVVADSISASASSSAHGEGNLYVSFSDNDYQSFNTARVIDLTQRKKQIYRCGSYEDRAVRLVHSGNAECRIQAFIARTL